MSADERFDLAGALEELGAGTAWRSETPERKAMRARRLLGVDTRPGLSVDETLERVLAESDLRPAHWLTCALRITRAVALVEGPLGNGTGFLVAPWLLMTNNHVLATPADAAGARARFGYQQQESGEITGVTTLDLDPDRFFACSPEPQLDYTVVAVRPVPGPPEQAPGEVFGTIPLHGKLGKILEGEPVNIVQHPGGRPLEIAFRNNRLVKLVDDDVLTYLTDTDRGSSGSPVLNDQWELVGLHRSSVEAVDGQGRPVDRNGQPVGPTTPASLRHWTANKGSRVSALVRDLRATAHPPHQQPLLAQLLGDRS